MIQAIWRHRFISGSSSKFLPVVQFFKHCNLLSENGF